MKSPIVITGQTATGKTAHAISVAKDTDGEIINFDSRQLFKGFSIVSGKDVPRDSTFHVIDQSTFTIGYYVLDGIKIWLYDVVALSDTFSSGNYREIVDTLLNSYFDSTKTPIFVGGSYLYLKQILFGTQYEVGANEARRIELNDKPVDELQEILYNGAPEVFLSLNDSDVNNPRRLIRRIEIFESGANKISTLPLIHPSKIIGFKHKSQGLLIERVRSRVEERINSGAIDEVRSTLESNKQLSKQALDTLGVKQIIEHLNKETTLSECITQWTQKEVAYANRQYSFMKQNQSIVWSEV